MQTGRRDETEAALAVGVPSHPVPEQHLDLVPEQHLEAPFPIFVTLTHREKLPEELSAQGNIRR